MKRYEAVNYCNGNRRQQVLKLHESNLEESPPGPDLDMLRSTIVFFYYASHRRSYAVFAGFPSQSPYRAAASHKILQIFITTFINPITGHQANDHPCKSHDVPASHALGIYVVCSVLQRS